MPDENYSMALPLSSNKEQILSVVYKTHWGHYHFPCSSHTGLTSVTKTRPSSSCHWTFAQMLFLCLEQPSLLPPSPVKMPLFLQISFLFNSLYLSSLIKLIFIIFSFVALIIDVVIYLSDLWFNYFCFHLKFTYNKVHFLVHSSMSFDKCRELCNHQCSKVTEGFHHPKWTPLCCLSYPTLQPQKTRTCSLTL